LRYDKQLGALPLLDMTVVKFMLSTLLVGMVGVYLLKDLGMLKLSVKPTNLGANIVGGLIFGAGWGLLGFCPGNSAGAIGEGRWNALWGILGMLVGAGLYSEFYPGLKKTLLAWGKLGKITWPQVIGVNHWLVIPIFDITALALFSWFEKRGL
jgi:uncharacterized membrane protein YedE/YeeE